MRLARAAVIVGLSAWYLASAFRLDDGQIPRAGLGDWMDPYFINYLLEHWYHALVTLSDPTSPPMYFPERGTLGYSHGLILYAPYYAAVRPFLDPFQAYTVTLLLVALSGATCLYLFLRRAFALGFAEAGCLTACFLTSANVVNEPMGVWSQRASVFLIPPILLLGLAAVRAGGTPRGLILAFLAGCAATLLLTQDFYTGIFVVLLGALVGLVLVVPLARGVRRVWRRAPHARVGPDEPTADHRPYVIGAWAAGVLTGTLVFAWIYLGVFLEGRTFAAEQLLSSFKVRAPRGETPWTEWLTTLSGYDSLRPFWLMFGAAVLAWIPAFGASRRVRFLALWCLIVAVVVFLIPLRIGGFSLWLSVFASVPGLSVLRDPSRIIYVYDLAAVILTGALVARLGRRRLAAAALAVMCALLLVTDWNTRTLRYDRPVQAFRRWVDAPVSIDPACRSFFIKGASEAYMVRSGDLRTLYALDAGFIALKYSLPTLNGYSAWEPDGWHLGYPHEPDYPDQVRNWIARSQLTDVCVLDIDARAITPFR